MIVQTKEQFATALRSFAAGLQQQLCTPDGGWAVRGFIDAYRNIYSISADTKLTSKILEIHIFPLLQAFADDGGYSLVLAEHQNHYPDVSFVSKANPDIKYALDLKTTYRRKGKPFLCKGFTLGSHGQYFRNRQSTKNIRFPYASYNAHFCLGLIYSRNDGATIDETRRYGLSDLDGIASVMNEMSFFIAEKWQLAGEQRGSGNTANIGSIVHIGDIVAGRGMFAELGESWFDEFWMNYGLLQTADGKKIMKLAEFVAFRGGDSSKIVARRISE